MRHPTTPRARRRRTMVAGVAAACAVGALARLSPAAVQQHVERVEVARVVVDTRVLDARGRPVRGLGLDDFRVFIDGEPARIESVRWEGDATFAAGADGAGRSSRAAPCRRIWRRPRRPAPADT